MLVGLRGRGIEVPSYPRVLHGKIRGFSIIEILITTFILSVLLSGLFLAFSTGQFSFSLSSAKSDLQSEVRQAMDWIIKDLRQAISWDIARTENTPSTIHIKFNLWNWNTTTNTWELTPDYIEYNYDSDSKRLTRTFNDAGGNQMRLEFNNIIEAPFYTTYVGTGDPSNSLDPDELRNDRKLIILITGQKHVRGSLYVPFKLKSEVKIRNG